MKKLLKENRVLFVLVLIIIISFCIILYKMFTYFYNGNGKNNYGTRLKDKSSYKVDSKLDSAIKELYSDSDKVTSVSVDVRGKIIYITYTYNESVKLDEAKELVKKSLEVIGEKNLSYYDIQYIIKNQNEEEFGFPSLGYKNASNSEIVWINNTVGENNEE